MMNNYLFRCESFKYLTKQSGIVNDIVNKNISQKQLNFSQVSDLNIGPGVKIVFPKDPVKDDNTVDIMFQFRGGSPKLFAQAGVNAIIVMADAGGVGGGPSRKAFGSSNFVNTTINSILKYVSNKTGETINLGKLGLSAWSGGYDPIHGIMQDHYNGKQLIKQPDYVGLFDGMHHSVQQGNPAMKVWEQLAADAQKGKAQFVITHTAVDPVKYPSTTTTTNYLLNNLGVKRQNTNNWTGKSQAPVSVANSGNFYVYQLYDKQAPYMSNGKVNVPGTAGHQHIQALQNMPDYWPKNWG